MVYQGQRFHQATIKPSKEVPSTRTRQMEDEFLPWSVTPPMLAGNDLRVPYTHFALIGMDTDGSIRTHTSSSIEKHQRFIFGEEFREHFIRSTGAKTHGSRSVLQGEPRLSNKRNFHTRPEIDICSPYGSRKRRREDYFSRPLETVEYHQPEEEDDEFLNEKANRIPLEIGNEERILAYYKASFMALQQLSCRQIAKAYIKTIEPRKQVKHPYNGGRGGPGEKGDPEKTKPDWWPAGVIHREPDHLRKPDRVQLLIHIFRNLGKSHGITAEVLEEAAQDAQRKIEQPERREVLDEIYVVRRAEESFERGEIDANTVIYVTNRESANKAAEREDSVSDGDQGTSPTIAEHDATAPYAASNADDHRGSIAQRSVNMSEPEQHQSFSSDSGVSFFSPPDTQMERKASAQSALDYYPQSPFVPPQGEQQPANMLGQWSAFQQPPYFPVDYGTASVPQIMPSGVIRSHQPTMPDESLANTGPSTYNGLALSGLPDTRTQPPYDFMSPTIGDQPPFRAGSFNQPQYLPQTRVTSGGPASHYK